MSWDPCETLAFLVFNIIIILVDIIITVIITIIIIIITIANIYLSAFKFSFRSDLVISSGDQNNFNSLISLLVWLHCLLISGRSEMFLQIDLGYASKTVTAIATQGHYSSWAFVQAYLLIFSRLEGEWFYYKEGGVIKVIKNLKIFELNIQ